MYPRSAGFAQSSRSADQKTAVPAPPRPAVAADGVMSRPPAAPAGDARRTTNATTIANPATAFGDIHRLSYRLIPFPLPTPDSLDDRVSGALPLRVPGGAVLRTTS